MKHKLYTRLLSLALAVGLVIGMLPSAAAVDTVGDGAGQPVTFADPDSPLKLKKTVTDNGNKTYTVNLEAYTTGTVTSETKTKPVDIVLVLDQSGSMANNFDGTEHNDYWDDDEEQRQYALKQAVNNFIDSVANQYSNEADHRISIVTYTTNRSGSSNNITNLSNGWVYTNAVGETQLKNSVSQLPSEPSGGTPTGDGMERAEYWITGNGYSYNGSNTDRSKVVILFTDGTPGNYGFTPTEANQALSAAYNMKQKNVTVYTVGIFEGANPNQLYGTEQKEWVSSWLGGDYQTVGSCNGNVGSWWGQKRSGGRHTRSYSSVDDIQIPASNRFMNYLSSNYQNAQNLGATLTATSSARDGQTGTAYNDYFTITQNYDRAASDKNYYFTANDSSSLDNIFQEISESISSPSIELGAEAQVIDEVTQYFDLPSKDSAITIQQADYNGSSFGAAYDVPDTVQARIEGQKVIVTGFDFDKNFVTDTAKEDGTYGKKLIISFTITPDPEFWGGNQVPTNVLANSGVKASSGLLAGNFPDPGTQDVPLKEIALTDKDVNVYYGGSVPDAAGLVSGINFPNNWRTDYVEDITYSVNNTVSNTEDGTYTVTATLSPKYAGTCKANTADATAKVYVYKPVVTWTDSTQAYKTPLNDTLLNSHHVSTTWEKDGKTSDNMYGEAPTLTYTFAGESGALPQELTDEVHVKVSGVKIGEKDITDVTSFKWQSASDCPTTCKAPNPDYQFRIHVQKGGLTITKTVEGLDENGLNELKDKLTFDVTGDNGYTQNVPSSKLHWTYNQQDGTWTGIYKLDVPTGSYTVTETGYDTLEKYSWVKDNSTEVSKTANVTTSGGKVEFTNYYIGKDGTLNINKVVTGFANNGKPVFDFKLTAGDGTVYYYHVDMTGTIAGETEKVASVTLPVGEYTITELSNQNYTCTGATVKVNDEEATGITNGGTIEITPQGTTTVTFTNDPKNTDIPTDGGTTENRVDKIENGVIVWKKEVYGTDHPEAQPSPNPNDNKD